ncbi:MAG: GYD domain-containing protein [Acidimicrobiales bacterium]
MPKYLLSARYSTEGTKGLLKEGGTSRRAEAERLFASVGGKVEAFYFAFGGNDLYAIVDFPDHASAAAAMLTAVGSGALGGETVVLLTPEELDDAAKKSPTYRPPGA